jgi:hypothetical protein
MSQEQEFTGIDIEDQSTTNDKTIEQTISLDELNNKWCKWCNIELVIVLTAIVFICAPIVFIIFSIMALVNTSIYELHEMCPETNLWIYLLISLIIGIFINRKNTANNSSNEESKNTFSILIIPIGILCWGSYELWGVECVNEIKSNSIYTMSEISVIVGWVAIAIRTIVSCIGLCISK